MASDNQSESQETNSTSFLEDSFNISFENLTYSVRHSLFAGDAPYFENDNITRYSLKNESVELECFAVAYPQPTYRWFYEIDDILKEFPGKSFTVADDGSSSTLTLKINASNFDKRYACKANNDYGSDYTMFTVLQLEEPVKPTRKIIVNNVSGTFNAGELTVVLGPSGAGKSTLMDILSGYTNPTEGNVQINGRPRNCKTFRRRSCYILQNDMVQNMLTIQESLNIAANLKLGNHISNEQKKRRVEEIVTSLGLNRVRHTRAVHLSGGQRKRLAIGLELVSDPPVMFLDEPTSGLDSSMSKQMVYLLHLLARQGRTVVVTMHQPSAALLGMVDRIYVLVNGRCAYMGSVKTLLPCLQQMNLTCPPYHNPLDFLIEISNDHANQLVEKSQNGKCCDWITNSTYETDKFVENLDISSTCEDVLITLLPPPTEDPARKILTKIKSTYATSFWKQLTTLTQRSLLSMWRDSSYSYMVLGIHFGMALFMGMLFYDIGEDAKYVRDNYSFLQFSLMFLMYTAFSCVSIKFPEQIPVVRREHFNRWYMTGAYYASTLISSIPTQLICTLTFTCVTFWLTGQPLEWLRFLSYCCILLVVSFVALCIGLLNGSMFSIKNGVIFGPFIIMPFVIFSGFFLRFNDSPYLFRWMFHLSFLKHGLVGLVLSIYGLDRPKLPCSDLYCHYSYPSQFLQDTGMTEDKYHIAIAALTGITVVVVMFSYIILKIRLKSKW